MAEVTKEQLGDWLLEHDLIMAHVVRNSLRIVMMGGEPWLRVQVYQTIGTNHLADENGDPIKGDVARRLRRLP